MKERDDILSITHKGSEDYSGVVYVATLNDNTSVFKSYSCYIDELPRLLDEIHVDDISDKKYKINFYITHNTFKTFKDGVTNENLFSFNNIVVDVDCHQDMDDFYRDFMLHTLVEALKKSLSLKFPEWTFVNYTGRGIQIWWSFEQVSYKLSWLYEATYEKLITLIDQVIKDMRDSDGKLLFEEVQIDPSTKKTNGFFRLPETYNPRADKMCKTEFGCKVPYKLQNLVDALDDCLDYDLGSQSTHTKKWDFMLVCNKKRIQLLEHVVSDRLKRSKTLSLNINSSYGDGYILFMYYNFSRYIYSVDNAREKTTKLNSILKVPDKTLDNIYKDVDKYYNKNKPLKFRNSTIIKFLDLTLEEQDKYDFHAISKWDWSLCVPNKTRDARRKKARQEKEVRVITLYNSGLTQAEVAKEVGLCENTVRAYLQKHHINRKQENIRQIQLLKSEHFKQKEVAEALNIGVRTVKRYWNIAA